MNTFNSDRCPNCRSNVEASPPFEIDTKLVKKLKTLYPKQYENRMEDQKELKSLVDSTTKVVVGNFWYHIKKNSEGGNTNKWIFYVRDPQGKPLSWIRKVVVHLHPTFAQNKVVLTKEPFQITRVGWGTFEIDADIYVKQPAKVEKIRVSHMLNFKDENCYKSTGFQLGLRYNAETLLAPISTTPSPNPAAATCRRPPMNKKTIGLRRGSVEKSRTPIFRP